MGSLKHPRHARSPADDCYWGRSRPTSSDAEAFGLLLRVFDNTMRKSTSPCDSEIALVKEIAKRMHDAQRAAWLTQLRVEYKAKRNFVRDLPQH